MTRLASALLSPISALYGAVVRLRLALYRNDFFNTQSVEAPVISVGNITAGGTGKTPVVDWIARRLADEGLSVCVLTRGYGRDNPNNRVLASDRQSIRAGVRETGDEALLLAEHLIGKAAVVCDANRVDAARWAMRELGSEIFVLDDGFQHVGFARDLDIVLIDATAPWGKGMMLPSGRLREPVGGLARADVVILTRSDQVEHFDDDRNRILELSGNVPVFTARSSVERITDLEGNDVTSPIEEVRRRPALAFCGIGNPQSFFNQLRTDKWTIDETTIFRDHYVYRQTDIDQLVTVANLKNIGTLITTSKDGIKLRGLNVPIECLVVEMKYEFDNEQALMDLIVKAARSRGGNAGRA